MALKSLFVICLQACLFQMAYTQCANNFGPAQFGLAPGPQINSLSSGIGPIGPIGPNPALNSPSGPLAGPGFGYPAAPGSYGPYGQGAYPGYGGTGSGDVAVVGELPVAGSTLVAGQVPVIGGVQFGGSVPAAGVITITGSCSCGANYGY